MYIGFGVGGAGLLVGAITGGLALDRAAQLHDACPDKTCPPDRQADYDEARTLAHVSTASLVGGAVGVGFGAIGLVLSSDTSDEQARGTSLRLLVGNGSLGVTGVF